LDSPDSELEESECQERGLELSETQRPEENGTQDPTLLQEMDRLKGEVDNLRELYLRKLAEFDNFRKRIEREREEMRRTAAEDLVRELIPVLDNFERALQHVDGDDSLSVRQGVELISKQLWDILTRQGMEMVDPAGQHFDPELHEAVQRVEGGGHRPGTVVSVLAKGYLFGGRLVRPALVSVAVSRPAQAARAAEAADGEGEEPS
ncbi:MAG: nucleotide exchange factor GrpE, partial [Acidobacteria bacterium]|nr:nucleotide exchange factor GrpE [Acidobacteriota bacterium]